MGANERRVYEFIVRRFLACCSDDAKGESTLVEIEYGEETFFTNGLLVVQRNYLDVYPYEKWESSQQLPNFVLHESFEPTEANIVDGQTSAPGYLTEPELISLMDANGIGTDATMAEHIAKIKERNYVQTQLRTGGATTNPGSAGPTRGGGGRGSRGGRGGRGGAAARRGGGANNNNNGGDRPSGSVEQFIPTTLGMALIEGYDNMGLETSLAKPFLRKEMELSMRAICAGTKTKGDFVHETLEQYRDIFVRSTQQAIKLEAVSFWINFFSVFLFFSLFTPFWLFGSFPVPSLLYPPIEEENARMQITVMGPKSINQSINQSLFIFSFVHSFVRSFVRSFACLFLSPPNMKINQSITIYVTNHLPPPLGTGTSNTSGL